jgi:hypothetical protein
MFPSTWAGNYAKASTILSPMHPNKCMVIYGPTESDDRQDKFFILHI